MKMGTPRSCQGQMVDVSFGWDSCGRLYRRVHDQSDRTTEWYVADKDEASNVPESYDPNGHDYPPPGVETWTKCAAPRESGDAEVTP